METRRFAPQLTRANIRLLEPSPAADVDVDRVDQPGQQCGGQHCDNGADQRLRRVGRTDWAKRTLSFSKWKTRLKSRRKLRRSCRSVFHEKLGAPGWVCRSPHRSGSESVAGCCGLNAGRPRHDIIRNRPAAIHVMSTGAKILLIEDDPAGWRKRWSRWEEGHEHHGGTAGTMAWAGRDGDGFQAAGLNGLDLIEQLHPGLSISSRLSARLKRRSKRPNAALTITLSSRSTFRELLE